MKKMVEELVYEVRSNTTKTRISHTSAKVSPTTSSNKKVAQQTTQKN